MQIRKRWGVNIYVFFSFYQNSEQFLYLLILKFLDNLSFSDTKKKAFSDMKKDLM